MGMLVDGIWTDDDSGRKAKDGAFVRPESLFRDRITADGSSAYPAASGRYHLYAARSCPWAHRTLIYRAIKGLDDAISLTLVGPQEQGHGWEMSGRGGEYPDALLGATFMYEVYQQQTGIPSYTGRVTVPVLWDQQTRRIVNNESPEIIRMLNTEMNAFAKRDLHDQYPRRATTTDRRVERADLSRSQQRRLPRGLRDGAR